MSRGDDSGRSECCGRTQDRAHIVRIGDLVENDECRLWPRFGQRGVEIGLRQRQDFSGDTLMDSILADDPGYAFAVQALHRHSITQPGLAGFDGFGRLHLGLCGNQQPNHPPPAVVESGHYGVSSE